MHIILPLFLGVLAVYLWSHSCSLDKASIGINQVQVPYSCHEYLEQVIVLAACAHELMVSQELLHRDTLVWFEALLNIVMSLEQIKEFVSAFLKGLGASLYIWVSRWVEFLLHLVNLEYSISICIQLLEGLSNQA